MGRGTLAPPALPASSTSTKKKLQKSTAFFESRFLPQISPRAMTGPTGVPFHQKFPHHTEATSPNRPAPFPLRVGFLRLPAGWVSFSKIIAQRRVPVPRKASGGPAGLTSKSQKIREQRFSQSFSVGSSLLRRRVTTRGQWVPRGHPAFWLVWFVSAHSFQTHLPTAT